MRHCFLLSILLLASCGGNAVAPPNDDGGYLPDASDASRPDVKAPDASPPDVTLPDVEPQESSVSGMCNALANTGPVVGVIQFAADPPMAEGGTIADGMYTLTATAIYTGTGGPTGMTGTTQTTIAVMSGTIQIVSTGQPSTRTVTLVTSGPNFTATDSCPDAKVTQGSYTATASTFMVFLPGGTDDAGARTVAESFTKQ